jgi:hypothetical protein
MPDWLAFSTDPERVLRGAAVGMTGADAVVISDLL